MFLWLGYTGSGFGSHIFIVIHLISVIRILELVGQGMEMYQQCRWGRFTQLGRGPIAKKQLLIEVIWMSLRTCWGFFVKVTETPLRWVGVHVAAASSHVWCNCQLCYILITRTMYWLSISGSLASAASSIHQLIGCLSLRRYWCSST